MSNFITLFDITSHKDNIESLIGLLGSDDDNLRRNARESLITIGKACVPLLILELENFKTYKARWEATKALGDIHDIRAIPILIKTLSDEEGEEAWLAAEALRKYKMNAWPALLKELVKHGSDSDWLCHGANHVFNKQKANGLTKWLDILRNTLEVVSEPGAISVAAYNLLMKMKNDKSLIRKHTSTKNKVKSSAKQKSLELV